MDESLKMEDSNCLSCIFDKLKTKVKQEAVRLDHIIPYISKDGKYRYWGRYLYVDQRFLGRDLLLVHPGAEARHGHYMDLL